MTNTHYASNGLAGLLSEAQAGASFQLDGSWWGFGGVHGGLALSLLTAALSRAAQDRPLRQIAGRFLRPLRGAFSIELNPRSAGKTTSWFDAAAVGDGGRAAVSASAVFGAPGHASATVAPPMPTAPPASDCPTFTVPPEFVPFASRTEIRPVGRARPFSGGSEPELIAWLRLAEDPAPPDCARLVLLMDALAPSLSAVLRRLAPLPTVAFTITPSDGLAQATSPWVLLKARTEVCGPNGWVLERLDAWAPDGAHLGSAEQLRLLLDPI